MNNARIVLTKGKIASVDKVRWTCSVYVEHGPPLQSVPIAPMYLGNEAEGIYYLPKVGTVVLVAQPYDRVRRSS